ncbi:MAG: hypothetical protein RML93_08260 [Anaerolineales bacterium]|nr:hypothetical protein [Anaerolineales bacterium]MDW8447269.1 hypothetical protein [Anaerolineales bacterium]
MDYVFCSVFATFRQSVMGLKFSLEGLAGIPESDPAADVARKGCISGIFWYHNPLYSL